MVIESLVFKRRKNVRSSTMTQVEEGSRSQTTANAKSDKRQATPNQKSVNGQAQARQENKVDFFVSVVRRVAV